MGESGVPSDYPFIRPFVASNVLRISVQLSTKNGARLVSVINNLIYFHYFLSCYKLCFCINFLTGNYSEALSDSKIAIGLQSSPLTAFKQGKFSFQQSLLADRRSTTEPIVSPLVS